MKKTNILFTCCFCGNKFDTSEEHNAEPVIKNGSCCEECNKKEVLPYRFGILLHAVYRA